MPQFSQKKILPYQAQQIFALVMDIEKYPEFLPWCKQTKIIENISDTELTADLLVEFKNFFEKYRSLVKFGQTSSSLYFVEARAIEGPFKKLFNSWKIHEISSNSCEVEFFIDFEFNSFLLNKMVGGIFEKAATKMMEAFEERAQQLY